MAFTSGRDGIPLPPEEVGFGDRFENASSRFSHLRIGRVIRVDYIRWMVDISWMDMVGTSTEVPVCCGMGSPRTFMGFMPEVDSIVVCGFVRQSEFHARPVVIAFLPTGAQYGYNFDPIKSLEDDEQIRSKMQKVYPGEGFFQSVQGTWVRMDSHFQAYASDMSGLWINAFTHSINGRALNFVIRSAMGKLQQGLIIRNGAPDHPGVAQETAIVLPNTKKWFVVTVDNSSLDDGGTPWVESREVVRETHDAVLDSTDEFEGADELYDDSDNILLESVRGTLVGDDPSDTQTYGQVLRKQVFPSATATAADAKYEAVSDDAKKRTIAEAVHLLLKQVGTSFDVNKEGKLQISLAASSNDDPLGAGRSVEIGMDGSMKLVVGSNTDQQVSIDVTAKGGIKIKIEGESSSGYAAELEFTGNVKQTITGDLETTVTGDEVHTVQGNRTVTIGGTDKRDASASMDDGAPIINHN